MFVVTPRKEEPLGLAVKFPMKPGRPYLVQEPAPEMMLRAFDEAVRRGQQGLLVTRRNPTSLREDFGWSRTPILWLTETPGQNHVAPGNPGMFGRLVEDFAKVEPTGIVALDGVETIFQEAGRAPALKTLQRLRDVVTSGGGVFLVSVATAGADPEGGAFFEREFDRLPLPGGSGSGIEDLFVIDATTGILLSHQSRASGVGVDADLLAGMLTAIMDFAKTSFSQGNDQLRDLTLGERHVALERGARVIVAAVFRGHDPPDVHSEMRAFVLRAEARYGPLLAEWSGDMAEMGGLALMARRLFL